MKHELTKRIHSCQRGFIPERQLVDNIVDVDTGMRTAGTAGRLFSPLKPEKTPIGLFLDFAAAFLSVCQAWITLVVKRLGLPSGLVNLILGIYSDNRAFHKGSDEPLYIIISGILQGCPMSGTIFAWCLNPCLNNMVRAVQGNGLVRACADDIALVLRSLRFIIVIAAVYRVIGELTLMQVKPKKCVIIPVAVALSPEVKDCIQLWLARKVPEWKKFRIEGSGKYLGAWLGPASADKRWGSVEAKFADRLRLLWERGAPPSVNSRLYASRALPVLAYLCQFYPLSEALLSREHLCLHKLLKSPMNTFTLDGTQ